MKEEFPKNTLREGFMELQDEHWFGVMSGIKEKFGGGKPSPMEIRADVLLELAGIPSGQYSALQTESGANGESERTNPEGDEAIAEYLTNKAGLTVHGTKGITSRDLRDRYPDGLPDEVLRHLDEKTQKIIEAMYEYDKYARENFPDMQNELEAQDTINLHFLPGGIPLILVGYCHNKDWQKTYGQHMKEVGKEASVISIEGFSTQPLGQSLGMRWADPEQQTGDYNMLMKDLVASGYSGIFTEVDGRDTSRVSPEPSEGFFSGLPGLFYEKYLAYLQKENPKLGTHIGTTEKLKNFLQAQASNTDGLWSESKKQEATIYQGGKRYYSHPAFTDTGEVSLALTGNELGQVIYTDALSAIKLHLLGRIINEGSIPKGAIVDYEGSNHLSSKSFFIQYPEYAMEVVLRTIPELLARNAEERWSNRKTAELHAEKVFNNTDWEQVITEIFRIPLKKVADPKPGVDRVVIGENQRPMEEAYPDSYVLETTLGNRRIKEVVEKMEELIQKFAF